MLPSTLLEIVENGVLAQVQNIGIVAAAVLDPWRR